MKNKYIICMMAILSLYNIQINAVEPQDINYTVQKTEELSNMGKAVQQQVAANVDAAKQGAHTPKMVVNENEKNEILRNQALRNEFLRNQAINDVIDFKNQSLEKKYPFEDGMDLVIFRNKYYKNKGKYTENFTIDPLIKEYTELFISYLNGTATMSDLMPTIIELSERKYRSK